MSETKAASKSPLLGALIYSAVLLSGAFYAIRRLFLELSMPTIAALIFVGILATIALLVWVLGVLESSRKE